MLDILLLATTGVFAIDTPSPVAKPCSAKIEHAGRAKGSAKVRKLGEMPPANQVLTVLRSEDGCPKPVVVRRDIGGR